MAPTHGIVQSVFASPGAIAFELGPLQIRWYGILMATAILVGFWLAHRRAHQEGLPADQLVRAAQWAVVAGLVGARLYEVAFNWDYYGRYPGKIIAVWEGGLAMHGGLIVGPLVGAWLACALGRAGAPRARRHRAQHDPRPGHRPLGELLQRGSVRGAHGSAVEALHLAEPPADRVTGSSTSSTPRSSTSRCGTCWCSRCSCALDPAAAGPVSRGALLLLHRALLGGPVRDRSRCGSTASGSGRSGWGSSRAWRACWWRRRGSGGPCGGRRSRRRRPRPASGYG